MMLLEEQLGAILEHSQYKLSGMWPADWAEENMRITSGKFQGKLSFDLTPYWRKLVNHFSPYDPITEIALMGASQIGKTRGVIEPSICYSISECPCNMGYFTGHADLSEESMESLDGAIDACKYGDGVLRDVIKDDSLRKVKRTGDTVKFKKFPQGKMYSGSISNHKILRQKDLQRMWPDDIDASKKSSSQDGNTVDLVRMRASSFGDSKKILWSSTPILTDSSLIETLFLKGDQQYWYIPCQCCYKMIPLCWEIDVEGTDGREKAGIVYKLDKSNYIVPGSVEYVCQLCSKAFNERNKYEFLLSGDWTATATAQHDKLVSYQMSRMYSPKGMDSWEDMARAYIEAAPLGQPIKEDKMKTFRNLYQGLSYKPNTESPKATAIMKNQRTYDIGTIPEKMSMADGNGRIVLITCAADMNGKEDDARLDFEVVAWAQSGASYSIKHGSIGTFVPRENTLPQKDKTDRERWTYEFKRPNSVWGPFDKIIDQDFITDTGRKMKIMFAGLDCGFFSTKYAYPYIDGRRRVLGLKGKGGHEEYTKFNADLKYYYPASERTNLYLVSVGKIKDEVAQYMELNWTEHEKEQPFGFMNFPKSNEGLYQYDNYFTHYEAEECKVVAKKDGTGAAYRWEKKNANVMNHAFDCRVYNIAVREIILGLYAEEWKKLPNKPKVTWHTWSSWMANSIEETLKRI